MDKNLETIELLTELIKGLKRGECWCDMGIGHPSCHEHSKLCKKVRDFLRNHKKEVI